MTDTQHTQLMSWLQTQPAWRAHVRGLAGQTCQFSNGARVLTSTAPATATEPIAWPGYGPLWQARNAATRAAALAALNAQHRAAQQAITDVERQRAQSYELSGHGPRYSTPRPSDLATISTADQHAARPAHVRARTNVSTYRLGRYQGEQAWRRRPLAGQTERVVMLERTALVDPLGTRLAVLAGLPIAPVTRARTFAVVPRSHRQRARSERRAARRAAAAVMAGLGWDAAAAALLSGVEHVALAAGGHVDVEHGQLTLSFAGAPYKVLPLIGQRGPRTSSALADVIRRQHGRWQAERAAALAAIGPHVEHVDSIGMATADVG